MNKINISKIKDYEFNNKIHNQKQIDLIKKSIKEFWFNTPVIIDKNNVLIAWHWRILAAKQMQLKEVPFVIKNNLTDLQVKKYRLLDNEIASLSDNNIENIKFELEEIKELQWENFDEFKIDELFCDYINIPVIQETWSWLWLDFPEQQQFRDKEEKEDFEKWKEEKNQNDNINDVDYSDKNKEIDINDFLNIWIVKLQYEEDKYNEILQLLSDKKEKLWFKTNEDLIYNILQNV